jgi:hypothetical protein
MRVKLTDVGLRAYRPRAKGYSIGDAACPGLCVRVTPKGVKSFAYTYRDKGTGKVTWLTIGRYPDVALARAREITNDARKTVAAGGTPLAPKSPRAAAGKKNKLHRVIEWVDFSPIFDSPAAVVLSLWACGQRACVVHHVHSGASHRI